MRATLGVLVLAVAGCASPEPTPAPEIAPPPPTRGPARSGAIDGVPAELNSARAAAMVVSTWPPVRSVAARREIFPRRPNLHVRYDTNTHIFFASGDEGGEGGNAQSTTAGQG